jgi:hypothetical protein
MEVQLPSIPVFVPGAPIYGQTLRQVNKTLVPGKHLLPGILGFIALLLLIQTGVSAGIQYNYFIIQ